VLEDSEGPSTQAGAACFAYTAMAAARAAGLPDDEELLAKADGLLDRATATITEQALTWWQGTFYLIARARRADLAGDPSVDAWRKASAACARIGAGLALGPRLGLAAALLVAGERDEARTSLPELVADARAMGAAGAEAEATRLARRHRVPVSEEQAPCRLDVLTAREREVLDVLVTGATNRAIAERLFISEKTVSVHVTNLLAKLGCANRGEAAALARELAPAD
jgi:DNA-binding CsgD family transcriptional regulator